MPAPRDDIDKATLYDLYVVQQKTMDEVARMTGCGTKKPIMRLLRKYGIPSRRTGPKSGADHKGWKGGRIRDYNSGGWMVYTPDHPSVAGKSRKKYVQEHRLVMESMLGRFLGPSEVVHHVNGNPSDNRPENLQLFETNGKHLQTTLKGKRPKWTKEGRERMLAGLRRPRTERIPENDLREMYLEQQMTIPEIAKLLGCGRGKVCYNLAAFGIRKTPARKA